MPIKAPDIRPKRPLKFYNFQPMGIDKPVYVYVLSDEDFTKKAEELGYDASKVSAIADWTTERAKMYMKVAGIQHFAHELRHLQEKRDFHNKGLSQ